MKTLINILLSSLIFFTCTNASIKSKQKIIKNTQFIKIENNLINAINKHKQNKYWNKRKIKLVIKILLIGEKKYKIKHTNILALISLESYFNPYAVCRNRTSKDYGLTQQNSRYIKQRYRSASKILKKYKIKYDKKNKFDIALNLMSCILFKVTINKIVNKRGVNIYSKRIEKIVAYNLGLGGARMRTRKKIGLKYYRIYKRRLLFCTI